MLALILQILPEPAVLEVRDEVVDKVVTAFRRCEPREAHQLDTLVDRLPQLNWVIGCSHRQSSSKKSFPLSSTTTNAGKSTTSILRIASIPSSSKSTKSTLRMFDCASTAAGPPMLPR